MGTYTTLQARVSRRVIDLPAAVTAEVPILINEAIRALETRHNFKAMEGTASFTTVLATRTLGSMPSVFKEFRGEPWRVSDLGMINPLVWAANREGLVLGIHEEAEGAPMVLLDGDPAESGVRSFEVYPLPDGNSDYTDGEYRIKVPYWRFVADLSAAGDTNWFTVNAEEYIVNQATADAFAIDWDEQRMAIWAQRAENKAREAITADKRYRLSGVTELVPLYQGANSPRIRW